MNRKMHFKLIIFFILNYSVYTYGQFSGRHTIGLPTVDTLAEMNSVTTGVNTGAIVYNLETNSIYHFTGTQWETNSPQTTVYSGFFTIDSSQKNSTITIDKVPFRPNNVTFVAHANVEDFGINSDNGTNNNDPGIRNSFGTMNGYARADNNDIEQGVIYVGAHANSINDVARYSSNLHSIGVRYGDQNGNFLGSIEAAVENFQPNGFSLNVTYTNGNESSNQVAPTDIDNEGLLVFFTAYQ